jgi:uncharacterized membrane protein
VTSQTVAVWLLIVLSLLLTNLPFFSLRLFLFIKVKKKSIWYHLVEFMLYSCLLILIAWLLEEKLSQASPQGWEFYVVIVCLLLTLAFPGFVFRYLSKHKRLKDNKV